MCVCVVCFIFLRLHLWHMEGPRLGVQLQVQILAYTTATATWDPTHSVTYTTVHGNTGPLIHWARLGTEPASSWMLVGFANRWAMMGTPPSQIWVAFLRVIFFLMVKSSHRNNCFLTPRNPMLLKCVLYLQKSTESWGKMRAGLGWSGLLALAGEPCIPFSRA